MRVLVAALVATGSMLAVVAPAAAAPPTDVAAYCQAMYPQPQLQVRCLSIEHAAAARVSRASAGFDPEPFNGCLGNTTSWVTMEACLTHVARLLHPTGASMRTPAPGLTRADSEGGVAEDPLRGTDVVPALAPAAGSAAALAPSLGGSGLQPGMPLEKPLERPSLPIPEADADRQLRTVLERTGISAAQCRKKRYGPGWVTICEDRRLAEPRRLTPLSRPTITPPLVGEHSGLVGSEDSLGL
jgi:hypothetical protein